MARGARCGALLLAVVAPYLAAAQGVPVQIPKTLVFPNYDNILLGKDQALEAGAFIARAGDASANFYNPAGLVQAEKTSLNASSTGWVQTKITSEALGTSVTSSKIDNVPGYFGAVIDPPWLGLRNLRVGVSLTRLVAWSPGPLDQSWEPSAIEGLDRATYSSSGSFGTILYQLAAAWAPVQDRSLRLGFSFGFANTSYGSSSTLSGLTSVNGQPGQFLATMRAGGNEWDMVLGVGVQWDVVAGLTLGAVIRSPGIPIGNGSLVTYESSVLTAQSPTTSFLRDDQGTFAYKLPLEASLGVSYRFGSAQLEGDVRYHEATGKYDFWRPSLPLRVTTLNPNGTTTATTQGLAPVTYEATRVWNASIGGNVRIGKIATLHGGFYTSLSPVKDPKTSPLRKADLFGFTGGVDFQLEHFGFSLGAGYQFGSSPAIGIAATADTQLASSNLTLQSISILYAISYQF
jgi:hypothetical protein